MQFQRLGFSILFMFTSLAFGQPKDVGFKTKKDVVKTTIRSTGESTKFVDRIVLIQSPAAAREFAQIPVAIDNPEAKFRLISAEVKNNAEVFKVNPKNLIKSTQSVPDATGLHEATMFVIPLNQVKVGSEVRIQFEVKTPPIVPGVFSDVTGISNGMIADDEVQTYISDLPLQYVTDDLADAFEVKQTKEGKKYRLDLMPTEQGRRLVGVSLVNSIVQVSTQSSWKHINQFFSSKYEREIKRPLPPQLSKIVGAAAKIPSKKGQIEYVAEQLQKLVTYSSDARTNSSRMYPHGHAKVIQEGKGDCKDYSSAMTSILRNLGYSSFSALTSRQQRPLNPEMVRKLAGTPSAHFNHVIVWAKDKDGKIWWIDPTNPKVIADVLYHDILGSIALILDGKSNSVQILPTENPVISELAVDQKIRVKGDNSVHVEATVGGNASAYNGLAMVERGFGEGVMKQALAALLNPFNKSDVSYKVTSDLVPQYKVDLTSSNWVRERKNESFEVYINHPVSLIFRPEAFQSNTGDLGPTGVFKQSSRLLNKKILDPVAAECLVRSKWLDLNRTVDIQGEDTVILDVVAVKERLVSKGEVETQDFRSMYSDARDCIERGTILTYLNASQKTSAELAADKIRGPAVEHMTDADELALKNESDLRQFSYIHRKLYKYYSLKIAQNPKDADSYARRARVLRKIGFTSGDDYISGYLKEAMADVEKGLMAVNGESHPLLESTMISLKVSQRDFPGAVRSFKKLYSQAPNNFDTLLAGHDVASALKKYADAEKWLRAAVPLAKTLHDKRFCQRTLAGLMLDQKRYDESLKEYAEILSLPGVTAWDWHNAAIAQWGLKNLDKVIEFENNALNLMDFGVARNLISSAYQKKAESKFKYTPGSIDNIPVDPLIEENYLQAIKHNQKNVAALVGVALYIAKLAKSNASPSELKRGKTYLDQALRIQPGDAFANLVLLQYQEALGLDSGRRNIPRRLLTTDGKPPKFITPDPKTLPPGMPLPNQ